MMGIKILLTEFLAYTELGILINNRKTLMAHNDTWLHMGNDIMLLYQNGTNSTLIGGVLTVSIAKLVIIIAYLCVI